MKRKSEDQVRIDALRDCYERRNIGKTAVDDRGRPSKDYFRFVEVIAARCPEKNGEAKKIAGARRAKRLQTTVFDMGATR